MTFALPTYLAPVDLDGGFFLPGRGFAAQNDLGGHSKRAIRSCWSHRGCRDHPWNVWLCPLMAISGPSAGLRL